MDEQAQALDPVSAMENAAASIDQLDENEAEDIDEALDPEGNEQPDEQAKLKVKVKDESGNDVEEEVSLDDLKAGYMRQADYTRKTQAVSEQIRQVETQAVTRVQETSRAFSDALAQAQQLVTIALVKSPQELMELATADPSEYVKELAKQQSINSLVGQLQHQAQQAQEYAKQTQLQHVEQAKSQAWSKLTEAGITQEALSKIYADASKAYGFTQEDYANLYDARSVLALRDAIAYRNLKASKPGVQNKVAMATPMPSARAPVSAQERRSAEAAKRVAKPGAKLNDLAAFIANS